MTQPVDPNQPYQQQPQPGTPPPPPPPAQGQYVAPPPQGQPGAYPPPQAQPYGAPAYGAPGYARPKAPSAQMAMILGIVGAAGGLITCILGLVGIGGIIMGGKAKKEIAASGGTLDGASDAKLGVIFGWVGVGLFAAYVLIYLLFWVIFASAVSTIPTTP